MNTRFANYSTMSVNNTQIIGDHNNISGNGNSITGHYNSIHGKCINVAGDNNYIDESVNLKGDHNIVHCSCTNVRGNHNKMTGECININGDYNIATSCVNVKGDHNEINGDAGYVSGDYNTVTGTCKDVRGNHNNTHGKEIKDSNSNSNNNINICSSGGGVMNINGHAYANGIDINSSLGIEHINSISQINNRTFVDGQDVTEILKAFSPANSHNNGSFNMNNVVINSGFGTTINSFFRSLVGSGFEKKIEQKEDKKEDKKEEKEKKFSSEIKVSKEVTILVPEVRKEQSGEKEDESKLCVVCTDAPRSCLVVPCGHKCLCTKCSQGFIHKPECPVCRKIMTQIVYAFE